MKYWIYSIINFRNVIWVETNKQDLYELITKILDHNN